LESGLTYDAMFPRCQKEKASGQAAAQRLAVLSLALLASLFARTGAAASSVVPSDLQATLMSKLAAYDRNFQARAGSTAVVLIVVKPGNPRSALSGASMKSELSKLERIGGMPHRETLVHFDSAAALASRCRSDGADIVYVTPGLEDQIPDLQNALAGVDTISVSAVPESVPAGVVLGFQLVSGRPKILLNLAQAKRQNVDFKADVMKLMKVYR
jgi:hypothetical protein